MVRIQGVPLETVLLVGLAVLSILLLFHARWSGLRIAALRRENRELVQTVTTVLRQRPPETSQPKVAFSAKDKPAPREIGSHEVPPSPSSANAQDDSSACNALLALADPDEKPPQTLADAATSDRNVLKAIAAAMRDGAEAFVDLAPDLAPEELARRLARAPSKLSVGNRLRRVLGDPLRAALLMEWGRPLPLEPERLAMRAKALHLRHQGAMGIERAISSAGGIAAESLTAALELKALPGVSEAKVHFNTGRIEVAHDQTAAPVDTLVQTIRATGYEARPAAF